MNTALKQCRCGAVHSDSDWQLLPGRKVWHVDETLTLETRECVCLSTIAVRISLSEVLLGRQVAA